MAGVLAFAVAASSALLTSSAWSRTSSVSSQTPVLNGSFFSTATRCTGDGFPDGFAQDGAVEGHLVDVSEAFAVGLEPLEAVAGLEVDDAVFAGEPVDADLAGDVAVGGADGRLGRPVVQQRGCGGVRPDGLLEFQDEAEVLLADDLLRLRDQPVGASLRGLAVGLAGLRVHGAVGDEKLLVECFAPFQDKAVCGASKRQRGVFGLGDFAAGLAAIEFGGFAEVGQKVARHVLAASARCVVLVRGDGEEFSCVHWRSLWFCSWEVSFSRHQCIQENRAGVR